MKLTKKTLCLVGVSFLLGSSTLLASEKSALEVMNKTFNYTGNMDKYAFNAVITENVEQEDGTTASYKYNTTVKVHRPNKLRVDTKSEYINRTNYINDGLYTILEHNHGYYGQLNVPKNLDKALDSVFKNYDIKAPLASLVYSDMNKRIKPKRGKYFGTMNVGGVECDYVAFKNKKKEIHVWVERGEKPLVKAYSVIEITKGATYRADTSLVWNTNPRIKNSDFVFTAPKGVMKISIESAK